jgi:Na+/melibiose symporter-like transporter
MTNKEQVEIRRAPKFLPFLLSGGAVGLLLAVLLFFITGQFTKQDWASVLGVLIAFMCDRLSKAKAKKTTATKLEG